MTTYHNKFTFLGAMLVAGMLGACGGGGGGGDTIIPPIIPPPEEEEAPANPIVYMQADATTIQALYLVDPLIPGTSAQINPPLVAGGEMGPFSLSPDLTHVAYAAFQDSATEGELYLVDLAAPGASTKLSGPLSAGGFVPEFVFSPNGSQIAYIADQDVFGQFELYLVDLDSPGVSTRLNPDLPIDGDVRGGISFNPDGSKVLYVADQDVEGVGDLYLADIATPGSVTKVNPPFVDGGDVTGTNYEFSPDGATIVYIADQDVNGVNELYAVDVNSPGASTKLNPALVAEGDLCTFRFSPDSTKVGYCADQDADGILELYLVELAVPGVSMKVNSPLVADGDVQAATFRFGPDSDSIVYRADQEVDGINELYRVEVATPGTSVKINPPLVAEGDVSIFQIHPDGLQLAYVADQDTDGLAELYLVDLATPGVSTKLNPARQGAPIWQIEFTEDGSQLYYHADQDTAGIDELYRVDVATAGVSTKINSALPADNIVFFFAIAPGFPF